MSYLRYIPSSALGAKFAAVRYPSKGEWTHEKCQEVLEQMCGYGRLEIVDDGPIWQEKVTEKCDNEGNEKRPPAVRQHRGPGALPTNKESTDA